MSLWDNLLATLHPQRQPWDERLPSGRRVEDVLMAQNTSNDPWQRIVSALQGAALQNQMQPSSLPDRPQFEQEGQPLFASEATAQVDTPTATPGSMPHVEPVRSTITGSPTLPTTPGTMEWINRVGRAYAPQPVDQVYYGPDTAYGQEHPKLGRFADLLRRQAYFLDPTGPAGQEYAYQRQLEEKRRALPLEQFLTGQKMVDVMDKMRTDQTNAESKARLDEALFQERMATTAAQNRLADQRGYIEVSPGATVIDPEQMQYPYTAPSAPTAAGAPARTQTVRSDPTSKTGYSEYVVGLDPQSGQEVWAQKIGEAPKPSTGPREGISPTSESNLMMRLSTNWQTLTKEVREMQRQANVMNAGMAAAKKGDLAAGAQAVLITFQKILDPTSVVRESEYARSAAGQALVNRIEGAYERLAKGGAGVPLPELEKFATLANQFVTTAASSANLNNEQRRIGMIADHYGIPKEFVFGPVPITEQPAPNTPAPATGPAVGTIKTFPNGKRGRWDGTGWELVE